MNDTPSNLKRKVHEELRRVFPVTVEYRDEEFFTVTVRGATVAKANIGVDWDNIEAVGAADDASRFRIDERLPETVGACPNPAIDNL